MIVLVAGFAFYFGYKLGAHDALNLAEEVIENAASMEEASQVEFSART